MQTTAEWIRIAISGVERRRPCRPDEGIYPRDRYERRFGHPGPGYDITCASGYDRDYDRWSCGYDRDFDRCDRDYEERAYDFGPRLRYRYRDEWDEDYLDAAITFAGNDSVTHVVGHDWVVPNSRRRHLAGVRHGAAVPYARNQPSRDSI